MSMPMAMYMTMSNCRLCYVPTATVCLSGVDWSDINNYIYAIKNNNGEIYTVYECAILRRTIWALPCQLWLRLAKRSKHRQCPARPTLDEITKSKSKTKSKWRGRGRVHVQPIYLTHAH